MVEKMADNLICRMVREKLIDGKEKEHYRYAFISLTERFVTIGTILGISIWMKAVVPTVLFLIFFLELRKRTGGFHFNSFYQCYMGTILTYLVIVISSPCLARHLYVLTGLYCLAVCIILIIGSVNHPNMRMNDWELNEAKKAARILVLLEGSIILGSMAGKADRMLVCYMMVAGILCAFLISIAKILKQEVSKNEGCWQENLEACSTSFSSLSWITRSGVVSLSCSPKDPWTVSLEGSWGEAVRFFQYHPMYTAINNPSKYDSMYNQYKCHKQFARGIKTPWNIEPIKPNKSYSDWVSSGCN